MNQARKKDRRDLEDRLLDLCELDLIDDVLAKITNTHLGLNLEADKEELFWEQRAHVNWLKNEDRNTSFFHKIVVSRQAKNMITRLEGEESKWVYEGEDLLMITLEHFARLFTSSEASDDERLLGLVELWITTSMNEELLKPFTEKDIYCAVKMMEPLKALGIDGFLKLLYQRYWHIVGPQISKYCLYILRGEVEMGEINKTHIVLITKVERPKNITRFRPISLCNVIYKIIVKVLVERMSGFLENYIDEVQGAFIPRRHIR